MNSTFCGENEALVVAPAGMTELVRGTDQQLIQRVAPLLRDQSVALNLRLVERIDAAGIAALIALYSSARDAGHTFMVCNVSARIAEILALVGLEHILVSHNAVRGSHSEPCYERPAA
jgi:anti-anti-sigma factor